jgi:hypothetical protein
MFAVGGKSHFWFGGIIQPTLSRRLLLVVVGRVFIFAFR